VLLKPPSDPPNDIWVLEEESPKPPNPNPKGSLVSLPLPLLLPELEPEKKGSFMKGSEKKGSSNKDLVLIPPPIPMGDAKSRKNWLNNSSAKSIPR